MMISRRRSQTAVHLHIPAFMLDTFEAKGTLTSMALPRLLEAPERCLRLMALHFIAYYYLFEID